MRKFAMMLAGLGMTCFCLTVTAQTEKKEEKPKASPEEQFTRLDKNKDGKLSEDEMVGKNTGEKAETAKKRFKALDKNKDGSVDKEEYLAAVKAAAEKAKKKAS